jgi:hypothetical protein
MSVFAWLMLVITSVTAAPGGMPVPDASSVHAATSMAGDRCHHDGPATRSVAAVHHLADCCGGHAASGCHCPAMCATVVPAALAMIAPMPLSVRYGMPLQALAPSPDTAPPLRPPSP